MQDNKQLEEILSDSEQVKFKEAVAYLFNVEMEYDNENKIAGRIKTIQKYMVEQERKRLENLNTIEEIMKDNEIVVKFKEAYNGDLLFDLFGWDPCYLYIKDFKPTKDMDIETIKKEKLKSFESFLPRPFKIARSLIHQCRLMRQCEDGFNEKLINKYKLDNVVITNLLKDSPNMSFAAGLFWHLLFIWVGLYWSIKEFIKIIPGLKKLNGYLPEIPESVWAKWQVVVDHNEGTHDDRLITALLLETVKKSPNFSDLTKALVETVENSGIQVGQNADNTQNVRQGDAKNLSEGIENKVTSQHATNMMNEQKYEQKSTLDTDDNTQNIRQGGAKKQNFIKNIINEKTQQQNGNSILTLVEKRKKELQTSTSELWQYN